MKNFISKPVAIIFAAGLFLAAAPVQAQVEGTTTITSLPAGIPFTVDGTNYLGSMSAVWPQGSKHVLAAQPEQDSPVYHTKNTFTTWQWAGGSLAGNPVTITADPSIKAYQAVFQVQYGLNILFNNCADGTQCGSMGVVSVNGFNISSGQEIYEPAAASVILQAYPGPGYVFAGWMSASALVTQGFQTTVTMNAPVTLTALFEPAEVVNLATVPAGLTVLADRSTIYTPYAMEWGLNTVHSLGVTSPQLDTQGNYWVFGGWSDGGAATHAYTVSQYAPTTVTATFNPGATVQFMTAPQGLSLAVDGASSWPSYSFVWAVGETHTVQAPATQTDLKGRIWSFSNWSNGGPQLQTITVPQSALGSGMRVTANYTQLGHLTVTSTLAGLSVMVNGNACAVPCDIQQAMGTQLDISAPASVPVSTGSRQDFAGWSNGAGTGDLLVTLGSDAITVAANYHLMNYLATGTAPSSAATFTMQPASPDGFYDAQASVALTVNPLPGFRFRSWTGDLSGTAITGSLIMSVPRSVQAVFDKVPYIAPSGVSNAAGATPQSGVAAGSIVSIFGANLANSVVTGASSPMTQTLGGTTVQVSGRLLPLFFVSPAQINFLLPGDMPAGPQTLTVSTQGEPDVQAAFTITQDAPGLFATAMNGQSFAVATHADGSPVTPAAPVQKGETITLYGTGFGASTPSRPFGFAVPASPAYVLTDAATIQVGSATPVSPSAAFAMPGSVGVDAVQFMLGSDAPASTNAQLTVTFGGQVSNTVLLPIQ